MAQAISHIARGFQRTDQFPTKSSASFKAGQFLIWNNGVDRHAGSDANLGATSATTRIVGVAMENSTRADGSNKAVVNVMIAEPGTEFLVPLYHGTPASAVATPNGQLGTAYELRNVGGNYDSLDISATTNTKAAVVGFNSDEYPTYPGAITSTTQGAPAAGTTQYPFVWVSFLGSATTYPSGR